MQRYGLKDLYHDNRGQTLASALLQSQDPSGSKHRHLGSYAFKHIAMKDVTAAARVWSTILMLRVEYDLNSRQ